MYPVLFRIGSFEVTSFGVMLALAALVGLWLYRRELRRSGLPLDASDAGVVGVIGGLLGAKLLWTVEHASDGSITELLFSRGGLSWYGGLIGGVGAGLAYIVVKRWAVVSILAAATPALAFGHLIGRIGCFLVGDDYGTPSTLPWAVAFPEGLYRQRCLCIRRSCTRPSALACLDSSCSGGGAVEYATRSSLAVTSQAPAPYDLSSSLFG